MCLPSPPLPEGHSKWLQPTGIACVRKIYWVSVWLFVLYWTASYFSSWVISNWSQRPHLRPPFPWYSVFYSTWQRECTVGISNMKIKVDCAALGREGEGVLSSSSLEGFKHSVTLQRGFLFWSELAKVALETPFWLWDSDFFSPRATLPLNSVFIFSDGLQRPLFLSSWTLMCKIASCYFLRSMILVCIRRKQDSSPTPSIHSISKYTCLCLILFRKQSRPFEEPPTKTRPHQYWPNRRTVEHSWKARLMKEKINIYTVWGRM